jgi:hypothetical protein
LGAGEVSTEVRRGFGGTTDGFVEILELEVILLLEIEYLRSLETGVRVGGIEANGFGEVR